MSETAWLGIWVVAVGVLTIAGALTLETLGPSTMLYAIPPFFLGVYLAVSATWMRGVGLYANLIGQAPTPVHIGLQLLGTCFVGGAVLFVLLLPTPQDRRARQSIQVLSQLCRGEPSERTERALLPALEAFQGHRAGRGPELQAQLDEELGRTLGRCTPHLEQAFARSQGTHVSWRRFRDWLVAHPDVAPDAPVLTAPWRPLERRAPPRGPVEVDL